ncbi:MAG: integrase core domain-containing protein, partial [Opitutales bacterium]
MDLSDARKLRELEDENRRSEGLQARSFPKKTVRRGSSSAKEPVVAKKANEVWSWDFIFDTTENGQSVKILSLVDEATRYCIDLHVARRISSAKCLNRNWFINELDATVTIADWREEYNTEHPHSRLDFQSPADL